MRKLFWSAVPMLQVGGYLSMGILSASCLTISSGLVLGCASLCLLSYWLCMRIPQWFSLCPVFLAGFFLAAGAFLASLHNPISKAASFTHLQSNEGVVVGKVIQIKKYNEFSKIVLRLDSLYSDSLRLDELYTFEHTNILLYCSDSIPLPSEDTYLRTNVRLSELSSAIHAYQFNSEDYNLNKNIVLKSTINDYTILRTPPLWRRSLNKVQTHFQRLVDKHLQKEHTREIFASLVLGDKNEMGDDIFEDFSRAGALHLLAISGLHVGLVIYFMQFLLLSFSTARTWQIISSVIAIALGWCYILLTGMPISALRAGLVFSIIVLSKVVHRTNITINGVAVVFTVLLLWRPTLLYDIGFQLSFAAVGGLCLVMPLVNDVTRFWPAWLRKPTQVIVLSIVAQLSVMPLLFYHFHQFQLYAIISGTIGVVITGWCLQAGLIFLILGSISTLLAEKLAILCEFLFDCLYFLISNTAALPHAVKEGIQLSETALMLMLIAIFCFFLALAMRRLLYVWLAVAGSLLLAIVIGQGKPNLQDGIYIYPLHSGTAIDQVENGKVIRLEYETSDFEIKSKLNSYVNAFNISSIQTITATENQVGWKGDVSYVLYHDSLHIQGQNIDVLLIPPWQNTWGLASFMANNQVALTIYNKTSLNQQALSNLQKSVNSNKTHNLGGKIWHIPTNTIEALCASLD